MWLEFVSSVQLVHFLKWFEVDRMDLIDRNELKWTGWTEMEQLDQINPNGPKSTGRTKIVRMKQTESKCYNVFNKSFRYYIDKIKKILFSYTFFFC